MKRLPRKTKKEYKKNGMYLRCLWFKCALKFANNVPTKFDFSWLTELEQTDNNTYTWNS